MNNFEKVNDLFMEENDIDALELLYELTHDTIVKMALDWKKEYETIGCTYSDANYMYNDIISYLYDKYL